MGEVCAIFGAGEHWSDFGRLRNEKFPFADIQVYRSERIRRLALLAKILAPLGLSVEDWDGEAALLVDRQGRSQIAHPLGDVWKSIEDLYGHRIDPLNDGLLEGVRHAGTDTSPCHHRISRDGAFGLASTFAVAARGTGTSVRG